MVDPVLSPRESAKYIHQHSQHILIQHSAVDSLSSKLFESMKTNPYGTSKWKKHALNPKVVDETAIEWIFVADLLNFSFWPDEGSGDKFRVSYKDEEHTGYWSLCAVINRSLDTNVPLTSADYYSKVNANTMEILFRSSNGSRIPLLEERTRILNQAGSVMIEKFQGAFVNCVKQADGSAERLLHLIVENFPSFRDEANYKGKRVSFYKRAQILVADIWACFEGQGLGCFRDIDVITMFADYRIPQTLVYFGVLKYDDELLDRLKKGEVLVNGCTEEVEIRGNTIWAVELVSAKLKQLADENDEKSIQSMNSILIDFYLWDYRRVHADAMEHIPFHKTRCTYY